MEKKLSEIKLFVEGLTCSGCAMDMENIMLDMDGVEEASLKYADGEFTILYDPLKIKETTIFNKVKNLGFKTKFLPEQT